MTIAESLKEDGAWVGRVSVVRRVRQKSVRKIIDNGELDLLGF